MNDFFVQVKDLIFSRTAKDTTVVFVGNAISFLFGILFTIIAARQIEPAVWGIFAAVVGFVGIVGAIGDLGLTSGLFRFVSSHWESNRKAEAQKVLSAIFTMRLATALFLSVVVIIFSRFVSHNIFKVDIIKIAQVSAIGILILLLNDFQITILQAKSKWKLASIFSFLSNLLRLTFVIVFLKLGSLSLLALVAIFFLSPVVTLILSLFFERPKIVIDADFKKLLKEISRFSVWTGVNRTAGAVSSRVHALLLLQLATPTQAGIVGIAMQLSNAVLILIASFATVVAPRFASYKGSHLKNYFKKTVLLSVLISLGIILGIFFVNPVVSLLGPKYIASASVFKGLLLTLVPFVLFTASVNSLIYSFHKPQIIAILTVVQLPLIILGNIYAIPRWGIFGPVLVFAVWNLSTLAVSYYYSLKELNK